MSSLILERSRGNTLSENSAMILGEVLRGSFMAITLSDKAAEKIKSLLVQNSDKTGLRVKVVGGGCSGLQYKMDLDIERPADKIFEHLGARLFVDRKSFLYLNGTELDFSDDLMHAGFRLQNPNVKRSCGCGASRRLSQRAGVGVPSRGRASTASGRYCSSAGLLRRCEGLSAGRSCPHRSCRRPWPGNGRCRDRRSPRSTRGRTGRARYGDSSSAGTPSPT